MISNLPVFRWNRSNTTFFFLCIGILVVLLFACAPNLSSISGVVIDEAHNPLPSATVRIKATDKVGYTGMDGQFAIYDINPGDPVFITAWAQGFYINGMDGVSPGTTDLEIMLHPYPDTDNPDYVWLSSTYQPGEGEDQGCVECHSAQDSDLGYMLPVDEWLLDAHSQSAMNPRFISMYKGTDLGGNQSPLTRMSYNRDYGRFPIRPDPSQPYYGPGYKLDFPDTAGNCAACHVPEPAVNQPYGIDPSQVQKTPTRGISCDFCHKIIGIKLDQLTGLPGINMPGVLSYEFLRPPEGHQFFAGPLDDIAPGEDTFAPIYRQSQYCAGCHYGVFWGTAIYNSYGEWLESPYSDEGSGRTCQDCHMPSTGATTFALVEQGGVAREAQTIFSHRMPGAADETLLQNSVTMKVTTHEIGERLIVEVSILNDQAGHHIPTDSPLRHLILVVNAVGEDGLPLTLAEGATLPDWTGIGDPVQGYFAGQPGKAFAKILMELWTEVSPTGAYWNPTRIRSDNRIPAFQTDTSVYNFILPKDIGTSITVSLWFRRAFIELMDQKGWNDPDILMEQQIIMLP